MGERDCRYSSGKKLHEMKIEAYDNLKARKTRLLPLVTGSARFVGDLHIPGMLVGKLVYAPYPCARIISLDVRKARGLPGVKSVLTHADIPGENSFYYRTPDQPLLAVDRVLCQGEAIAAVAAETEQAANAAIEAIVADYAPFDGIYDPVAAMQSGAEEIIPGRGNIAETTTVRLGDPEQGFQSADVIVDEIYRTQLQDQAFIEPEGALVQVDPTGVILVYSSTQDPYLDRSQISRALGVPQNRVRVIIPPVGGAFGGKLEAHVQIHAALLAQATGRAVRIIRSREESFLTHVKRHPITIRFRSGATREGKLIAARIEIIGDTGPYENAGVLVMRTAAAHATGPYRIPHVLIESHTVFTNNPPSGSMRGFGVNQVANAVEGQMDALAAKLGIDPLEFRLLNAIENGEQLATGNCMRQSAGLKASLEEAGKLAGWSQRHGRRGAVGERMRRGWGIGAVWKGIGYGVGTPESAAVVLEMGRDGSFTIRCGAIDMGQGVHASLAILAAAELGIDASRVRVVPTDTDMGLEAGAADSSRQLFMSGNALLQATATLRQTLLEAASEKYGLPVDILSIQENYLCAEEESLNIGVDDLAMHCWLSNRPLHATGHYAMEYPEEFPDHGHPNPPGAFSFGTQIAQVLVDTKTGHVEVEQVSAVHDVGKVVNRIGVEGQIQGGIVMGLGYALSEELLLEAGKTLNPRFSEYLLPTVREIPEIACKVLEIPQPYGPHGVTGLGEAATIPTSAAILNAVSDALGIRFTESPLTPENILRRLEAGVGQ
jgi:nicotinate dehydrogenase large molybdopterin subunit